MKISYQIKQTFQIKPAILYQAWLNSKEHSDMTGGEAQCSGVEGGQFTCWDRYIAGENVKLIPESVIEQKWRTSEFKDSDEDSELIIRLREMEEGCELTLIHENIPEGQPDYRQGWVEHYFNPMKAYFNSM